MNTSGKKLVSSLNPNIQTRDMREIKEKTGNLYKSLAIIAKRSDQINVVQKKELHQKLEDFANTTDSLEEIQENREQTEISRFYERIAKPPLQALDEFLNDKIYYRKKEDVDNAQS